jgi:deoxyribonucleoside regulator
MQKLNEANLPLVEIARLYYEQKKTQEEIAGEFGTSRSTISRLLKRAEELGVVRIQIIDPNYLCSEVAFQLEKKYHLNKVIVVKGNPDSEDLTKRDIGVATAAVLDRMVHDNMIIGVSWGSTIYNVISQLTPKETSGLKVVQFTGAMGNTLKYLHPDQLTRAMADIYNGECRLLPAPAIVTNKETLQTLVKEAQISNVLDMCQKADIALLGIGLVEGGSLFRAGYIKSNEVKLLNSLGAIADIGCRFYKINGEPCDSEIDERTIGLKLDDLRKIPHKFGVATGVNKVKAIYGAIAGQYINILATDLMTAKKLLGDFDPVPKP